MVLHSLTPWLTPMDPSGEEYVDNGIGDLGTFAGSMLTVCIVLVVVAGCVSALMFAFAKIGQSSEAKVKSLAWAGRTLIGAVIVGSAGSAIYFGSSMGGMNLMPASAQQPEVKVVKKAARQTCENQIIVGLSEGDASAVGAKVLSPVTFADYKERLSDEGSMLTYTPKGPDCTTANTVPDACKSVRITYPNPAFFKFNPSTSDDVDPINKSECNS